MTADTDAGGVSARPARTPPLTAGQQALTAALRCYYADGTTNIERPHCQEVAVVAYRPIALCPMCHKMRSAIGRIHPREPLPGAELTALIDAARTLAQAQTHLAVAVGHARAASASWSHIGDAVGASRQGAQQRWGHSSEHASTQSTGVDTIAEPSEQEMTATN